ncbi:hypothetical protein BKA70DRAFT_1565411 [Coprinopsis sp. MPI-PUGE-AT-0042]|nr:hypothetical protein BKA70DRAFT_1565411 [Coprinopsis sp. MPI-PUGE-AT-0042]
MKAIHLLLSLLLVSSPIIAAPAMMQGRAIEALNQPSDWARREIPSERTLERRYSTVQDDEFLQVRVEGQLASLTRAEQKQVINHIEKHPDDIRKAALAGTSPKSFTDDKKPTNWRIDRQTATRGDGKTEAKVAVQRNGANVQRQDSTAASVAIVRNGDKDKNWSPSLKTLSKALRWSVKSGRETTLTRPDAQRQIAKAQRIKAAQDEGAAKAAKGNFRKGQVVNPASAKKFKKIDNWKGNGLPKPGKGGRRK